MPAVIEIADIKKLYDIPDFRKIHKKPIASLGGVGVFVGFFIAALLCISIKDNPEFQYISVAAVITFFLGLKDDILVISATKKFIGQILAAGIIIHLGGIRIESMHGLFGIHELPLIVSNILSYFTIIFIINAFNLIDGVDGLAGSLGLLTMTVFGTYFTMVDMPAYAAVSFAMAGSLLGFLLFNFNPAKIFLGDSGSLLLGLLNAVLVLKFISVGDSSALPFQVESVVAVGISILMIPLLDTLRVFSIRILGGRSPFSPDRNHIHHILLDIGLNHKMVTLSCVMLNAMFIAIGFFGMSMGANFLLLTLGLVAVLLLGILVYARKSAPEKVVEVKELPNNRIPSLRPTNGRVSFKESTRAVVEQ